MSKKEQDAINRAAQQDAFSNWSREDYATYAAHKNAAEANYKKTGEWNQDYREVNQSLRDKYGMTEDSFSYSDMERSGIRTRRLAKGEEGTSPQQTQQENSQGNSDTRMDDLMAMFQQQSQANYERQKALADQALNEELTALEHAYAEAVEQGKLSVREAEKQFEKQKSQIQEKAYIQSESTRAYSNDMGIQHSQQTLGLQQGDDKRVRGMVNDNISDRDSRINDIKDRLNTISMQKDLGIAQAKSKHGYALAGAQAGASSDYAQQMSNLMTQDYITDKQYAQEDKARTESFAHEYGILKEGQKYTKENIAQEFENKKDFASHESGLILERMASEQDFEMDKIEKLFENDLVMFAKQAGLSKTLQSMQNSGALAVATKNANARMAEIKQQRKWEMSDLASSLDPRSDLYKREKKNFDMETQRMLTSTYAKMGAELQTELIMGHEHFLRPGSKFDSEPRDFTEVPDVWGDAVDEDDYWLNAIGGILNKFTGYDTNMETYEGQQQFLDAITKALEQGQLSGVDFGIPWATERDD